MSKPRYDWWGYARRIAEKWEQLRDEYEDLHRQSITANVSGMPTGNGVSRTIENIAIRALPGHKQKEYEAACFALSEVMKKPDVEKRISIIKMYYWRKTMTIAGAGMKVGYAERTARRICWQYILAIGRGLGYITDEEYQAAMKKDNN